MSEKPAKQPKRTFQNPKGTRDFYPEEMLRRRYIVDSWRRVALRHGFEEIDGPTFEHLDLYTVKSGEGIVSELFSFQRAGGEDVYALRPEFTPTLARMYAARARQLPQPTKWFCVSNFFRAERPQRGRLREFFQWNCDVIGGEDSAFTDVEVALVVVSSLEDFGIASDVCRLRHSSRGYLHQVLESIGVAAALTDAATQLLDRQTKLSPEVFRDRCEVLGLGTDFVERFDAAARSREAPTGPDASQRRLVGYLSGLLDLHSLISGSNRAQIGQWLDLDLSIVRGLAYYTGMVFEVIAEGERAVAGGGRYDNLIEMFGGPPTPACGFGMGDVVLANLLDDRGLMPTGREMLEALSRPMPLRPDAFVVAADSDEARGAVVPLVARLRRGEESEGWRERGMKPWSAERYAVPPLHARRSYKATKNIGKLLADASACHARFAVIVEDAERCTVKDLARGEQHADVPLSEVGARLARV